MKLSKRKNPKKSKRKNLNLKGQAEVLHSHVRTLYVQVEKEKEGSSMELEWIDSKSLKIFKPTDNREKKNPDKHSKTGGHYYTIRQNCILSYFILSYSVFFHFISFEDLLIPMLNRIEFKFTQLS